MKYLILSSIAGSADFWLISSDCTASVCTSKDRYNANASSSAKEEDGQFEIKYGDGSTVSGPVYSDKGQS